MSQETETVNGTPETTPQPAESEKRPSQEEADSTTETQPVVQEDACILKSATPIKSPVTEATESFIENEKTAYDDVVNGETQQPGEETPATAEVEEVSLTTAASAPPQIVEVSLYSDESVALETPAEPAVEEQIISNGHSKEEEPLTNGSSSAPVECELQIEPQTNGEKALNGTIASELLAEDYKLPDVVEVKKHFEFAQPAAQNALSAPPRKGALSTTLDSQSVKQAYQDVRHDGSETQWAVFKFEGPRIVTSATGSEFEDFCAHFGDEERAFGYIRVQTGDEMSKRAKFLLVTWVGPSVSVLKRAKMSIDKALIKDVVSNFAVELQTENIADINLQNFEAELDKAAGAHYGTGIRS